MILNEATPRRQGGVRVPGRRHLWPALVVFCLINLMPVSAQDATAGAATAATGAAVGGEQTPIGQTDPAVPSAARTSLVSTWDFVRMVLVLAIVVGLIYAVFVVVRKTGRKSVVQNDLIGLLGSRMLTGNRGLHLVRVGKSVYLVGSSESSVGLVAEITDRESVDELSLAASKISPAGKRSFQDLLGTLIPQNGLGGKVLPDGLGFLRKQRERLRKIGSV